MYIYNESNHSSDNGIYKFSFSLENEKKENIIKIKKINISNKIINIKINTFNNISSNVKKRTIRYKY